MNNDIWRIIECAGFEELLTDYVEDGLAPEVRRACSEHVLKCPICHSLMNEVKDAMAACRNAAAPRTSMTQVEARILTMTMPATAMTCERFEEYLTDYLDGFLPAQVFHRWERHAVLCEKCTDLPGMVVRSIAACYTYKMDEVAVPAGLHRRILTATLGTEQASNVKAAWTARAVEWLRGISFPLPVPQFASVVMMLVFAAFVFSQTVSADAYQRGFDLASETYRQGTEIVLGSEPAKGVGTKPVEGTFVKEEGN